MSKQTLILCGAAVLVVVVWLVLLGPSPPSSGGSAVAQTGSASSGGEADGTIENMSAFQVTHYADEGLRNVQKQRERYRADGTRDTDAILGMIDVEEMALRKVKEAELAAANCKVDVKGPASRDEVAEWAQTAKVASDRQNEALDAVQHCGQSMRVELATRGYDPRQIDEAISQLEAKLAPLVQTWTARAKLFADNSARMDALNQTYGRWEYRDGKILFADHAGLEQYNAARSAEQSDLVAVMGMQAALDAAKGR